MPRDALIAVGGGLLGAVAAMAFLGGSFLGLLMVYVAPLPLIGVGLALGTRWGTIAALSGFAATAILGGLVAAVIFALVHALPAWTVTRLALLARGAPGQGTGSAPVDWFGAGPIVAALTVLAAGLMIGVGISAGNGVGEHGLQQLVYSELDRLLETMAPTAEAAHREHLLGLMVPLFPAFVAGSWVLMVSINGVLAQGVLVRMDRNIRPSPSYRGMAVPQWMSWPLVAAAVVALAGEGEIEYLGRNLTMVLAVPYFLLGLAVIHTLVGSSIAKGMSGVVLTTVYMVVALFMWAAVVIAGVGVIEQWYGLRRRMAANDDDE